jgi:hypothetical protein
MHYFQLLRSELCVQVGDAGDVAARLGQVGDQSRLDRSAPLWKTIGIVLVADFAASAAGIPGPATITLT